MTLNGKPVTFTWTKRKNQKRIIIRAEEPGAFKVSSPSHVRLATIKATIRKNTHVLKALPPQTDYKKTLLMPAALFLFGKRYPVHYEIGKKCVRLEDDHLKVVLPVLDETTVSKVLEAFLKQTLLDEIRTHNEAMTIHHPRMNLDALIFNTRYTKTRFGSCVAAKKRINLNLALVHYPVRFLHYVYAHEIVHLIHADHSHAFYRTLNELYPGHRVMRKELEAHHQAYARDIHTHI